MLKGYESPESATDYLRARIYLLGERCGAPLGAVAHMPNWFSKPKAIIRPVPRSLIAREMKALPPDRILAGSGELTVWLASADEIPNTLREIGRCRELTYREVGEDTGCALDLDHFDADYKHLVLWHSAESRVAGAYRLAATPDILSVHGIKGLYTSTLFSFQPAFLDHIGPALELGRSLLCRDYQKQYSPLLLLWAFLSAWFGDRNVPCCLAP